MSYTDAGVIAEPNLPGPDVTRARSATLGCGVGRYMRRLLATRRWSVVRVVPHPEAQDVPSKHVFDVFGSPANAGVQAPK